MLSYYLELVDGSCHLPETVAGIHVFIIAE